MDRVVIVGGGQAGYSAASKLRELGFEGRVSVLCAEPELPYQRPPLTKKYLLGEFERERLYLRQEQYYRDNELEVLKGIACTEIDAAARIVKTDSGELNYDRLLIATGSIPHSLPEGIGGKLPGVHGIRTLADIDAMGAELSEGTRAMVVGGGYIGLEAASALSTMGLSVTVVELADRILQRVAAAETAAHLRKLHEDHSVEVLEGTALDSLSEGPDGRVAGAVLGNGETRDVDVVVVGIGVVPATSLAEAAGLRTENGIRTDKFARTSDPSIFAAGDCASFPWRGGRIRLESVQNAIDQAEVAAASMLGNEREYDPTPWFWSDQFEAKLQIAGLGTGHDRIVKRIGSNVDSSSYWYFKKNTLLAVDAVNDPRSYMIGKRLLEMNRTADPEVLSDPDSNLKLLLKQ